VADKATESQRVDQGFQPWTSARLVGRTRHICPWPTARADAAPDSQDRLWSMSRASRGP